MHRIFWEGERMNFSQQYMSYSEDFCLFIFGSYRTKNSYNWPSATHKIAKICIQNDRIQL